MSCAKADEPIETPSGLCTRMGPRKHVLNGPRFPCEGANIRETICRACLTTLCRELCKNWLNRSICRLRCGLGLAKRSRSSIVFARWRQCAFTGRHIGATWRMRLNRPSTAATRPYVKILCHLLLLLLLLFFNHRHHHYRGHYSVISIEPVAWK